MGICDSKGNTPNKGNENIGNVQNVGNKGTNEICVANKYIENDVINQISKAVCKICYNNKYGTGFFMNMGHFKVLFTNYHIISEELLNESIKLEMHSNKPKLLTLDKTHVLLNFL